MIERHWDGIAAYCRPENKVSLGFVEGLNNKIRVFQRRAYARSRISPPQSPHLHASAAMIPQNHPFDSLKTHKRIGRGAKSFRKESGLIVLHCALIENLNAAREPESLPSRSRESRGA
jgi:hypothetical protein